MTGSGAAVLPLSAKSEKVLALTENKCYNALATLLKYWVDFAQK